MCREYNNILGKNIEANMLLWVARIVTFTPLFALLICKMQCTVHGNTKYPARKPLTQAAVPVDQVSAVRGGKICFVSADLQRYAICFSHDCVVIGPYNFPRRGNSDARWTPDAAVRWKILPRCSRPEVVVETPTLLRVEKIHTFLKSTK
jgi:hypothetical protein